MDLPGVFQLVTYLCRSITERHESQTTSLLLPTKSKKHKDKEIKELRSVAFDMLLFKFRPSSLSTDNELADPELTNDPTTDLLGVAITRNIKQQHEQAKRLSKCTDYLWKTGLCDNPLVKSGLKLLLNLVDEGPEENNQNKGFLNTGYSYEPQTSLNGEVPPYRHFAPDIFEGTHLQKSLYECTTNISGDRFIYSTNPSPDVDIYKMPGTSSKLNEYNDQSPDDSSFHYQFPPCTNVARFGQLLPRTCEDTVEEASNENLDILSPFMKAKDSLMFSDEFWEQIMEKAENNFRTWETAGNFCPAKEKPFLSEAPLSYIYQVMVSSQSIMPSEEKKELNFTIVESNDLVRNLKFLMTGMESPMFSYDLQQDTFVIKDGICLEGLLPDGLATLSKDFVDCAVYYRQLKGFSSYGQRDGFVVQALGLSIGNYLRTYYENIMSIDENVTILNFRADIQQLKMNLVYLCQLCRIKHDEGLPTGGLLLTYLYQQIVHFSHQGLASVLLSCLQACSNVYLRFLEQWLFEGSVDDPHREFFIQPNNSVAGNRTRNYWKFAFELNRHVVPIFLRDMELAILNTGKAVNLMRLVVPRDPLLYLLQQSSPRLPCVMLSEDIPRLRAEYETYRDRALSATGPTVSMKTQFQRDRDKEKAFLDRVQQVRQQRLDAMRAVRQARAQQEVMRKRVRLREWEEQMKIVNARKELEKKRQREIEAEIAEEMKLRREEDDRLREEEKQKIIKHYKDLEDIIEQRRNYTEREILREQGEYVSRMGPNAEPMQPDPRVYSDLALATATPNGNSQNNNSLLDNHPTVDKNLLNSTEDVKNRNVEALDISPTCDNILEATANFVNQTLGEKTNNTTKKKKKSTSDLDLSNQPGNNANLAKCTSELNLAIPGTIRSPYLSRRDSALRIRRRMLREEHPIGSELAGLWSSDPDVRETKETAARSPAGDGESESPSAPDLLRLSRKHSAMLIKEKHLGLDYFGIQNLESPTESKTVRSPTKQKIPNHDLKLVIPESTNATANRNRNKALYGPIDTVTGKKKAIRPDPPTFSKLTGCWVAEGGASFQGSELFPCKPDSTVSIGTPNSCGSLDTARKESSPRIDYLPEISISSPGSGGLLTGRSLCSAADTCSLSSSFLSFGINTGLLEQSTLTERGVFRFTPKIRLEVTERGFFQSATKDTSNDDSLPPCSPFPLFDKSWQSPMFERPMANIADKVITPDRYRREDDYIVDESTLPTLNVCSVSETIRKSLLFPLQTHMSIVHDNVMKMWIVQEELLSHLHSLRNYYFLLDGEFGRSVTVALFQTVQRVRAAPDLFNSHTLNTILANSLAVSTDSHNKNCERLSFVVYDTPAYFQHSSPDVLKDLNLSYKVTWPLNILIPDYILKKYSEVFSFLLKLWRASWTLEDTFLRLKLLNKLPHVASSVQYQQLQLYRHMMSHIITAIHGYVMATVLQTSWIEFQGELEAATTLDHIYRAHVKYVRKIITRCLLQPEAAPFQTHLDDLFRLVLKFHGQVVNGRWIRDPKTGATRHEFFSQLSDVFRRFQERASYFADLTHKLASRGYNSYLFELHQKLNMNDYYLKQA